MTNEQKRKIVLEIRKFTKDYCDILKKILMDNDLRYVVKYSDYGVKPFDNYKPEIDDDQLEDLFFDVVEHEDCVLDNLFEKTYVENKIAEYDECNSPKNRILQHMTEIERLKAKYNVTDEDLKK